MSDEEASDIDQRLDEIESRIQAACERCHNRTVIRLAREGRRLARQEHRLIPFLGCSYHLINSVDDVLAMKQGCEVAIEMIALLEDEDRARQFQPDLPLDEYEYTKWWTTGFAYKKLATLTGHTQGYNSDGMHQCISDGMNVCRRTGNLRDTLHFREFAVEVYRAADDLEMALHFARGSLQLQESDHANRRVASADDVASILSLQGNLAAAVDMVQLGWQYCQEFHNPYMAHLNFLPLAREVASMAGRHDLLDQIPRIVGADEQVDAPEDRILRIPSQEESPFFSFLRDQSLAVEVACQGDFDRAVNLLQPWDRQLLETNCLTRWFGVRCRLIAACRLAGRMDQARALAVPCEAAARQADDWITLRRLSRLLDESAPATPLAMVAEPDCGPFATRVAAPGADESGTAARADVHLATRAPAAALSAVVTRIQERLQASDSTEEIAAIGAELIAIDPQSIDNPDDASRLLQLARIVVDPAQARALLNWGDALCKRFPAAAAVLSMFATLAARWHNATDLDVNLDDIVPASRIESLFRQSLDLDSESVGNFARAGLYYLGQENYGGAERCLARGFRLDRTSATLASALADVYSATDRPRDALAVLDMALREGCTDPDVAWNAAVRAIGLEQYEVALAYLDRYEIQAPGHPWANHYRAFALLELNRPDEALAALDREAECNPGAPYHVALQRVSALGQLNRMDDFRHHLAELLAIPMSGVDELTRSGLARLFSRLWLSADVLADDEPLRTLLQDHLVSTGLAPNSLFDRIRDPGDDAAQVREVQFYSVTVRQPLEESWPTARGCLAGEKEWTSYDVTWGVLAADEASARELVLAWHQRLHPLPAEVLEVEAADETYNDVSGIVWQEQRDGR